MTVVEFECQGNRYALPLASVRRVVPSALLTPLPGMPEIVLGILNFGGEVATIINFHRRVGLHFSDIETSHRFLLIDIAGACIGLVVDNVSGVCTREMPNKDAMPERLAGADFVQTVVRLDDGLCIICNPEKFLLDEEKTRIGDALENIHVEQVGDAQR